MKRVIIIVLDGVGIGELPDAANYGDIGSNTLVNLKKARPDMNLQNIPQVRILPQGIGK